MGDFEKMSKLLDAIELVASRDFDGQVMQDIRYEVYELLVKVSTDSYQQGFEAAKKIYNTVDFEVK